PRRADLNHQINRPDVYSELQRRGRHQRSKLAAFQTLLRRQSLLASETAVMRGNVFISDPFAQIPRDSFGKSSRVYKDQSRLVFTDKLCDPVVDLVPGLARHHRAERRTRHFYRYVQLSPVTGVDDPRPRPSVRVDVGCPDQKAGDLLDGSLRRGESDPDQIAAGESGEPLH